MSYTIKMSMIEKVARVIQGLEGCYEGCNHCKRIAIKCIAAMREPSEEMILNGNKHLNFHPSEKAALIAYQAMIDAALKE